MKHIHLIVALSAFLCWGIFLFSGLAEAQAQSTQQPVTHLVFAKKKIKVGDTSLTVEIADSEEKRERGLMFRRDLPDGTGMLFVFPETQSLSFWMKNTFIDLAIGFFDAKKALVDFQEMKAVESEIDQNPSIYKAKGAAKYALEVPKGWFLKHKIKLGDKLVLVGGD